MFFVDKIYIASFANTFSSASSSDVGPFVDAFAHYAVEDVNNGHFPDILTSKYNHFQLFF